MLPPANLLTTTKFCAKGLPDRRNHFAAGLELIDSLTV